MEKILALLLAAAMCLALLCGCGSSAKENGDAQEATAADAQTVQEAEPVAEETADVASLIPEEPEPEIVTIDLGNAVVLDNEELKLIVKEMYVYDMGDAEISVSLENRTANNYVLIGPAYVNSFACGAWWKLGENSSGNALEIAPGEVKDAVINLYCDEVGRQGAKHSEILLSFEASNSYAGDQALFWTEPIYPYGQENVEKMEYQLQETDLVVMDNDNVRVIAQECIRYPGEYIDVKFLIENKSNSSIHFTSTAAIVDNSPWVFYHGKDIIPAGTSATEYMSIYPEEAEYYGLDMMALQYITFTGWVLNVDSFTDDTFRAMENHWRETWSGEVSVFDPQPYTLGNAVIALEIKDANSW